MNTATLSPREHEILNHLGQGLSAKHIARELNISHRTVEGYRQSIERKIKCKPIAYFYRLAMSKGAARAT